MGSMVTPVVVVLMLVAGAIPSTQDKKPDYAGELRNGDTYLQKRQYEQALQAYKRGVRADGQVVAGYLRGDCARRASQVDHVSRKEQHGLAAVP